MGLFNRKKVQTGSCDCGGNCTPSSENNTQASVKVLGSGCAKCKELEQNTIAALQELDMDTSVHHITDFAQIAAYGVMTTPALVVDGKVLSHGKVLKKDEVVRILQKARC